MSSTPTTIDISYRRIVRITSPVLVTQLSYTAMGVIDTMMVGRLGMLELGAVGLGNLLTWWFLSFFFGVSAGVNTFVAQSYGAGESRRVGVVFWQGVYLALAAGAVVALCAPWAPFVFGLTGAGSEMQEIAVGYSQIRLAGGLGVMLLLVADNFYRGLGRTDVPMFCALSQLVINCGLNYVLIFGKLGAPALGTRGAALGTVLTQLLVGSVLVGTIFFSRQLRSEHSLLGTWRIELATLRAMTRVSLPIGVQTFMEMGGISVFTAVVAKLGTAQMAATNAVIQVWSLAFMLAFALSVGSTTLVGQCLGARDREGARLAVARVMQLGLGLMGATGVLYLGFPDQLVALFASAEDLPALLPYARPLFLVVVLTLLLELRFNVVAGALRGAGDTTYPMLVTIGSAWFVFVPLVLWSSPRFGLMGAWWCLAVHILVMTLALELRFRGGAWVHFLMDEVDAAGDTAVSDSSEVDVTAPAAAVEGPKAV